MSSRDLPQAIEEQIEAAFADYFDTLSLSLRRPRADLQRDPDARFPRNGLHVSPGCQH
jgi:hypothetical protein